MHNDELLEHAHAVLKMNNHGSHTIAAEGTYPHQWLWDSCFIAIGLRHQDTVRAGAEILSLLRGQWINGMMPHMIFAEGDKGRHEQYIWRSHLSPFAPDDVSTSGITQPPMLAEAVVRIGEKMSLPDRRSWYADIFPALLAYHNWLYRERDPHEEGLVLQIHPYETGLDNTPPWISQLRQHHQPWWAILMTKLHADTLINLVRRDVRHSPPGARISNLEALLYYDVIRRLRRKQYNTEAILTRSLFCVEDLTFNCIFIRANKHLVKIAKTLGHELPDGLLASMRKTEASLENLWDEYAGQYFSRNFVTHKLVKEPSIATLMPLYAGNISKERAEQLVAKIKDKKQFGPTYPVPSVPLDSPWFNPVGYWQGPTWLNTNWLIIDGLKRYGFDDLADHIKEQSLKMVREHGFNEYFSPLTGQPVGANNFSWTAALVIDLIKN